MWNNVKFTARDVVQIVVFLAGIMGLWFGQGRAIEKLSWEVAQVADQLKRNEVKNQELALKNNTLELKIHQLQLYLVKNGIDIDLYND